MFFKSISATLIFFLAISMTTAQDTETRDLGSFDGISVKTSINATITKGNINRIEIKAKGVKLSEVTSEIENGTLKVGVKREKKGWGNWSSSNKVDVVITYANDLSSLAVSSSADLKSTDVIQTSNLSIAASSSGNLIVSVDVEQLSATVSSSGDIKIIGTASRADITASSSGDFDGKDLKVQEVAATASSSGDIHIHATEAITATASSSGEVVYYGSPSKKVINSSSGGSVKRH